MKAEKFLYTMAKQIHNKNVRQEIMTEYENHIADCKEALMDQGMTAEEAEEEAVCQMGDPVAAGKDMSRLYSKIWDIKMLLFFWGMGLLVSLIAFALYRASAANWTGVESFPFPIIVSDVVGIVFLILGFIWSGVEKWLNLNTFYAWARDWNGGGITNSAVFLLIGIVFVGHSRGLSFIITMIFVCSLIQLFERAMITLYRHKRETELLWEIGTADTVILPYKGKADIRGKHRKVITLKGKEIPAGMPIMIVGLEGMKPVVEAI